MKLQLLKGSTSVTVYVFIQNSSVSTGAGLTGLLFNAGSLVASQVRPLAARVAITLITQTVTGSFDAGGFIEIDSTNMPGVYRLDLTDAVCAVGVDSVVVMLKGASNMVPLLLEIQLTDFDLNSPNLQRGADALVLNTTATGSTATTIETNLTETTNDHYNGRIITWTGGALVGQSTDIIDYNGTSKALTVTLVTEAPADTDPFVIS